MAPPHIPPEIWRAICDQLADDNIRPIGSAMDDDLENWHNFEEMKEARLTLRTLCRVSKDMAEMAQAALFKCHHMDFPMLNRRRSHLLFLRTIMDSPRLASYVKEVSLDNFLQIRTQFRVDSRGRHRPYQKSDKAQVTSTYERIAAHLGFDTTSFPFNFKELDGYECRTGRVSGIILLTLPLLPNIEILRVSLSREKRAFKLLQQLQAIDVVKPFWRVKDLTLGFNTRGRDNAYDVDGTILVLFCPLLALTPNITTLRLYQCAVFSMNARDYLRDIKPCMPRNIKTLEVLNSRLEDRTMKILAESCTGLTRFVYQSVRYGMMGAPVLADEVTPKQLIRHLLHSKDTLKYIEFDFSKRRSRSNRLGDSSNGGEEYDIRLTKADFAEFPALETLVHLTWDDYVPPVDDAVYSDDEDDDEEEED